MQFDLRSECQLHTDLINKQLLHADLLDPLHILQPLYMEVNCAPNISANLQTKNSKQTQKNVKKHISLQFLSNAY